MISRFDNTPTTTTPRTTTASAPISDRRLELMMARGERERGFLSREKAVRHGAMPGSRPGIVFGQKKAKPRTHKRDQFSTAGHGGAQYVPCDTEQIVALYTAGWGCIEIARQMGLGREKVRSEVAAAGITRSLAEARAAAVTRRHATNPTTTGAAA